MIPYLSGAAEGGVGTMHVSDEYSSDPTSFQGRFAELMLRCFAAVKHV